MGGIWITAHNPQSQQVADSVNQKAHQSLVCELEKAGHSMTDAWSEDPQGHWPSEVGVFVWGMSVDEGVVWGRAYDQAAVLTVDPQGMSDLVWIT